MLLLACIPEVTAPNMGRAQAILPEYHLGSPCKCRDDVSVVKPRPLPFVLPSIRFSSSHIGLYWEFPERLHTNIKYNDTPLSRW
jgi:hypothetical protein